MGFKSKQSLNSEQPRENTQYYEFEGIIFPNKKIY